MAKKGLSTIRDKAILEIHDVGLGDKEHCGFSDCQICESRGAETEFHPVNPMEDLEEENRILKATLGVFFKVIVVDGKQYKPDYPLCEGCEHLTVARGWECYYKPQTVECAYPDLLKRTALIKESQKEGERND